MILNQDYKCNDAKHYSIEKCLLTICYWTKIISFQMMKYMQCVMRTKHDNM